jgi:hypothetical protein
MPPTWSQHGKSQPAQTKVATPKRLQTLNQKSNLKSKLPRLKVATFHRAKVATKKNRQKTCTNAEKARDKKIKWLLKRSYLHDVSFFKPTQRIQAFVLFLAGNVQAKHYVLHRNLSLTKILMTLMKMLHNGLLKLTATPSTVSNQNNDGSDKCLLV